MNRENFHIWEGVYASFADAEVDAVGTGFSGPIYLSRALDVINECMAALDTQKQIPLFHKQRSTLLPPVVAMLMPKQRAIDILDFGGGLGIGYLTLLESIPHADQCINYTILEVPSICAAGRELYRDKKITFLDNLPVQGRFGFDLVHSSSALQYVGSWQAILQALAGYRAPYLLLSDVFAGSIPSFATLQNYYGNRIPHWFWNLEEVTGVLDSLGYRLQMKSVVSSRRLGIDDILPMDNFPAEFRLQHTLHLLFECFLNC